MGRSINAQRILAIDPTPRGIAYAVLEGEDLLVAYGIAYVRPTEKRSRHVAHIRDLVSAYEPHVLVFENPDGEGSRRSYRVRRLLDAVYVFAKTRKLRVRQFSRREVRIAFGVYTKEAIARAIAQRFPQLSRRMPPHRELWMAEDPRMHLFDALALALTFQTIRARMRRYASSEPQRSYRCRQNVTGLRGLIRVIRGDSYAPMRIPVRESETRRGGRLRRPMRSALRTSRPLRALHRASTTV